MQSPRGETADEPVGCPEVVRTTTGAGPVGRTDDRKPRRHAAPRSPRRGRRSPAQCGSPATLRAGVADCRGRLAYGDPMASGGSGLERFLTLVFGFGGAFVLIVLTSRAWRDCH